MNITFLSKPLSPYDKAKVNLLKSIFPSLIIIHHLATSGMPGIGFMKNVGDFVMVFFFAMSGYGLVISYLRKPTYLDGFVKRSLLKLFVPCVTALILFTIYRGYEGIDLAAFFGKFIHQGPYYLVPTSYFIYILTYFYIFFFLSFKYLKSNIPTKIITTCLFVGIYYFIASKHSPTSHWYWSRCPGFCVGMLFAYFDNKILQKMNRWQTLLIILTLMLFGYKDLRYLCAGAFMFLVMYSLDGIKDNKLTTFLSSISLEMFIIQFIPIGIVMNDMEIHNTFIAIPLVLAIDIILAYLMHLIDTRIISWIRNR